MSEGGVIDGAMSEACANAATGNALDLEAIAAVAWALEPPSSGRRGILRPEASRLVDGLLTRCARGRGALDVAIGEGLLALGTGDRVLRLGYSGVGDYARNSSGSRRERPRRWPGSRARCAIGPCCATRYGPAI